MKLFKQAFSVVRDNNDEIFQGFGFKHKEDVTNYYVHPDNESYRKTTFLCQPIGEGLTLFFSLMQSIMSSEQPIGGLFTSPDEKLTFLQLDLPLDFIDHEVAVGVSRFKIWCDVDKVSLGLYDQNGLYVMGNNKEKGCPEQLTLVFCGLVFYEMMTNNNFKAAMMTFMNNPTAAQFVVLHEDFYQLNKNKGHKVIYSDLSDFEFKDWNSFADSYKVVEENKQQIKSLKVIRIVGFDDGTFDEGLRSYVPQLAGEFVLPQVMHGVCSAVTTRDAIAVLLHGPAGTGKTMACKLICQAIGLPLMATINCTENLDEYVLGKFMPEQNQIVFKESLVTKAIRDGGAVVFEELNFGKPQYLAFLNSLLDDNGFVRLDNGEVVYRHKNFRFFATMNLGYYGTRELNQALYNRFNIVSEMAVLPDEAITRMLTTRVPEAKSAIKKVLGVYHKIRKKIEADELSMVISPRNLENWIRMAKYEGFILAAEKTIIPIAKCDRAMEDVMRGIIMLYKWPQLVADD